MIEALEARRHFVAGNFDTTFGGAGFVTSSFGVEQQAFDSIVQADGKIVVFGGVASVAGGDQTPFVERFNTDGTLDTSFGSNGVAAIGGASTSFFTCGAQQADGKIVLAGALQTGSGSDFLLARFTTAGVLDTTYGAHHNGLDTINIAGGFQVPTGLVIDSSQKIWVIGTGASINGLGVVMTRIGTSGSIDTSFTGPGVPSGRVIDVPSVASGTGLATGHMVLDSSGRAVVAITQLTATVSGTFGDVSITPTGAQMGVARYNADGTKDATFSGDGKAFVGFNRHWEFGTGVAIDPRTGKIILAGTTGTGTLSFGGTLPLGTDLIKVATRANYAISRFTVGGALDSKFSADGKLQVDFLDLRDPTAPVDLLDGATDVVCDADGRVTVSGASQFRRQAADFSACRITAGGGLDASFGTAGRKIYDLGGGDGSLGSAIESDGNPLLAGFVQTSRTRRRVAVIRLLDD